jgi:cysteine synthase A
MRRLLLIESSGAPVLVPRYKRIKQLGYTLIVARHDLQGNAEAEALVDHLIPVRVHNFEDLEPTVDTIVEDARRLGVGGVLARWDASVPVLVHVSTRLGIPTFPEQLAETLRYKHTMREAFAASGLPSARHARVQTLEDARQRAAEISYPIVLKPSLGYGSWGVVRVDSEAQLKREFPRIFGLSQREFNSPDLLVEEYLDGTEMTVDSVVFEGEELFTNITEKTLPMDGTQGFAEIDMLTPPRFSASDQQAIRGIQSELIRKFRIHNAVIHTEMRLTSGGPRLLEINPRVAGANIPTIIKIATGVDLEEAALDLAFGRRPHLEPTAQGYAAIRVISPPTGGVLTAVDGIDAVRRSPRVVSFTFNKAIGERVLTVPYEIQEQLGYIVARGDAHEEVLRTLEEAGRSLRLEFGHEA